MKKKTLGWVIVLAWLLVMGLLFRREYGGKRLQMISQERAETSEAWMGVFHADGRRVGHIHWARMPEEREDLPGARMDVEAEMAVNLLGGETEFALTGGAWFADQGGRADFAFQLASGEKVMDVAARLADGALTGEIRSAGEVTPIDVPVPGDLLFGGGFGTSLRFPKMQMGEEYRVDSFNPLTLSKSEARVTALAHENLEIAGETMETLVLRVESAGIRSRVWIDDDGDVVQAETPIGLLLRKIAPQELLGGA